MQTWTRLLRTLSWFGVLIAVSIAGCSRAGHVNAPVDASLARATLRTALDSWKKGDKMDALQQASPAIVVRDLDWETGHRLLSYQIVNDGEEMDAHLYCPVKLTLQDPQGKEIQREVTYIISTHPAQTVFRKVF